MKLTKFAVVGYGHIGKRHAQMIESNNQASLEAIVDVKQPDEIKLDSSKYRYFNSIEALIASKLEIDVICIATPNGYHAEQAILVLENGINVVIEKPIALKKEDAEKIVFTSIKNDCKVFSVMQNRFSPPSIWLKTLVDSQILGKIYFVQLNCYWNRDDRYYLPQGWHGNLELDGGTLFTQFSHFIDLMYWIFGDIENIKSRFYNFNHKHLTEFEDSGVISFDFKNIGSGVLNFSTSVWNSNLESSMTIIAENGSIKVGGQYMDKVEYCNIKEYVMPELKKTNPGNDYGFYKGSAQNHNYVIDNVVKVLNSEEQIATNALEGLKVVEIIEKMYKAKL